MTIARPTSLDAALDALDAAPDADLLAGGTDLMVETNFGHRRPEAIVALRRVPELRGFRRDDGRLVLGAGLTYTDMQRDLAGALPALADAARTVGSPQIRNAGTLGGNVGTASPAGDTLPVLAALDAEVLLAGAAGERTLPLGDFVTGPKRTDRRAGELIREVRVPAVRGPQAFLKVGPRNAMVISVACLALVVDLDARRVRCGLGSVAPVPLRPTEAEEQVSAAIDWDGDLAVEPDAVASFGRLAASAARPISDHRSTAEYRRHIVDVMARRALERTLAAARDGGFAT
jgi:CO/xanthine dehydrogenase FAD-binding subunit